MNPRVANLKFSSGLRATGRALSQTELDVQCAFLKMNVTSVVGIRGKNGQDYY